VAETSDEPETARVIQMPEMDEFEIVRPVGVERMPITIFVTAHNRYALRAFEAHALDCLLKPFGKARFAEALSRGLYAFLPQVHSAHTEPEL
jgi:DNA-binding LytR/AlgR family response regulator